MAWVNPRRSFRIQRLKLTFKRKVILLLIWSVALDPTVPYRLLPLSPSPDAMPAAAHTNLNTAMPLLCTASSRYSTLYLNSMEQYAERREMNIWGTHICQPETRWRPTTVKSGYKDAPALRRALLDSPLWQPPPPHSCSPSEDPERCPKPKRGRIHGRRCQLHDSFPPAANSLELIWWPGIPGGSEGIEGEISSFLSQSPPIPPGFPCHQINPYGADDAVTGSPHNLRWCWPSGWFADVGVRRLGAQEALSPGWSGHQVGSRFRARWVQRPAEERGESGTWGHLTS
jgi:hypothetical protein